MIFVMAALCGMVWFTTRQDWSLLATHIYLAAWMLSDRRADR